MEDSKRPLTASDVKPSFAMYLTNAVITANPWSHERLCIECVGSVGHRACVEHNGRREDRYAVNV
jgi:hypothetical protein